MELTHCDLRFSQIRVERELFWHSLRLCADLQRVQLKIAMKDLHKPPLIERMRVRNSAPLQMLFCNSLLPSNSPGGSSVRIAARVTALLSLLKGCFPLIISYSITPRLN